VINSLEVFRLKVLMPIFLVLGTKYWKVYIIAYLGFKCKACFKNSI
jgi:hypothetical protein